MDHFQMGIIQGTHHLLCHRWYNKLWHRIFFSPFRPLVSPKFSLSYVFCFFSFHGFFVGCGPLEPSKFVNVCYKPLWKFHTILPFQSTWASKICSNNQQHLGWICLWNHSPKIFFQCLLRQTHFYFVYWTNEAYFLLLL